VLSGVDLVLGRRERLGIVGANGSGKSTLVDLMSGRRKPTIGTVEKGPTVVVGYYDQLGAKLDLQASVQELVAGPHRSPGSLADIALMKRFLFIDELPYAKVGGLSGGERRRLQLLLVIAARPNVLLFDEPTNDLDLDTLRILEDFLDDWPGALVVISHDRTFLERATDRLVTVADDGAVVGVPGGVSGWIAQVESGDLRKMGSLPSSASPSTMPPATTSTRRRGGTNGGAAPGQLLRRAEKNMTRLERERDKITEALTVTLDHVEMKRLGAELTAAQTALDEAEDRWLTLVEDAGA
jgi:ATP-binding cassette subfamily F protein uup